MGAGVGVMFLVVGAVLYWAVEVDLPYVEDDAFGAILMTCGLIGLAASLILRSARTQTGIGAGIGLIAAGALVYWAIHVDVPYLFDGALGAILMAAGTVGVIAAIIMGMRRPHA
jgi:hypothetical protein